MKKILFLSLCLGYLSLHAQQFDDGSFESKWDTVWVSATNPYIDYSNKDHNDLFKTLNSLYELSGDFQTKLTAFMETSAQDGNYAVKVVSENFHNVLLVPGVFGTIPEDFAVEFLTTEGITVTLPFAFKPAHLKGYYKYAPVASDSATIEVYVYDEQDRVVAGGTLMEYNPVSEWTFFDIPLINGPSQDAVRKLRMLFISSAGYNFDKLLECRGQENSALSIDNVWFEYESGIREPLMPSVSAKVFPNPVSGVANFEFTKEVSGQLIIYNMLGAEVYSQNVEGSLVNADLSHLNAGTYFYRILSGKEIITSGKFICK